MKSYEYKDSGGRNLCKQHHMLRCSECFYVGVLERENKRYREALEFYADIDNWTNNVLGTSLSGKRVLHYSFTYIENDNGEKARQALGESE